MTASKATPLPVAPPPTTRMSSGFSAVAAIRADSWTALGGTTALRSLILWRTAAMEAGPLPRSLAEYDGWMRNTPLAAVATVTAAATPSRRRRMAVAINSRV